MCAENVGIFGIEFAPFAIPLLFSIPATERTNQLLDLKTFLGAKGAELEERIFNAFSNQERVRIAEYFLESLLRPVENTSVIAAVEHIGRLKGNVNMDGFAKNLPLGQRQFERSFKEIIGTPPNFLAK